jgi:hypothetical protein
MLYCFLSMIFIRVIRNIFLETSPIYYPLLNRNTLIKRPTILSPVIICSIHRKITVNADDYEGWPNDKRFYM